MQLTRFTDLGLRIVMRLAVEGPNAQLHTDDLAAQLCVSYTHATKVVARLSEMGAIESTRGRHGESASPRTDSAAGWVRWPENSERSGEVIDCEGEPPCPLRRNCRLREALRSAQDAFFTHLDQWTVAEIARPTMERK